jgi:hypothetical protein
MTLEIKKAALKVFQASSGKSPVAIPARYFPV